MDDAALDRLEFEEISPATWAKLSERQLTVLSGKLVNKYESRGQALPERFKSLLAHGNQCNHCNQYPSPLDPPKVCGRCKGVQYCSIQCQKTAWKGTGNPGIRPHKILCEDNKRHMQRLPLVTATIKQFPWGRVEDNGLHNHKVTKARFDVYGSTGFGYWSQTIGENPHRDMRDIKTWGLPVGETIEAHSDGYDLLHHAEHLTDRQGWKLDKKFIPYRDLSLVDQERWPALATEFEGGIHNWKSWYAWRKLPLGSPAALLMDFPLTAYQLLTQTLKVTSAAAGSAGKRVALGVHMLGAEIELNFLPLYSELALLLPYHDITITVFGYGVRELARAAAKGQGVPGCPAWRALNSRKTNAPVFEYAAPRELGGSTLKMHLHGATDAWTLDAVKDMPRPDALIAHNAGLCMYPGWTAVIRDAFVTKVPFAVTDYAEQSAEFEIQQAIPARLQPLQVHYKPEAVQLNPFHRPGQRVSKVRVPFLYNGFTIAVVGGVGGLGDDVDDSALYRT